MNEATTLRQKNQNTIIDQLDRYISNHFPDEVVLITQIASKVLIILVIFLILDFLQRKVLLKIVLKIVPNTKNIWMNTFIEKNVFTSFFRLLPLGICYLLVPVIFYPHPQSFHILDLAFSIFLITFIAKFLISVINSYAQVKNRDRSYVTVGLNTFLELLKMLIIVLSSFIIISIVFDLTSSNIFTFIGATMAVIILVFKDPILGFVAGINISNSKQLKSGDYISISKYNLEGSIVDINLITTKILNKDKTVSTIPTYDLISTEVRNYDPMKTSHTRRIKRSIVFNSQSIEFLGKKEFEELKNSSLLKEYFTTITLDEGISHTNMGIFRKYVQVYLKKNSRISQKDTILIRLLDPTIYGIPLEVYCFTDTSDLNEYEEVQAEVFEHIISISSFFGLKTVSVIPS
ncbi:MULTISPECIES: mechanosensitive ion channel family protein [unclassified Apibacter]|uniref:mechanosensitive ion channel family protein n=1 Tax=unclassified Apibacter TaxID=2630820 RepID=UPI00135E5243|nr:MULTISPECIES: mechanosensitive ion channel domain-containing protein [unclassified Apibacter]MXP06418.1 mechanosensitive ion channel [Apibacter sp. B3546]MXP12643.1 mechanosensitive ion channel [Apibacter sp. B3239]